ncbi:ThuA domain-containing protein [Engelhardtia mirabilis]|uniref:Trehalose utilization n=1 Tax=Engelhardtia mirabilis TaxID=2528011 RepID=A0A518BQ73_9BACT|nr:Trehalose utilization [Planctomycetes bacterium Pla133]QDV03453.1 Trehalose utilization [Planctomycetes bacterium Pla86]
MLHLIAAVLPLLQSAPDRAELEPGVDMRLYQADRPLERVHEPVPDASPNVHERRDRIEWTTEESFGGLTDNFVAVVTAWLDVPAQGSYEFRITSDDGSMLLIDEERLIWNGGLHAPQPREGKLELDAGLHALKVFMFEAVGGQYLSLEWRPPGAEDFAIVPTEVLWTEAGVTRVVSPGPKQMADDLDGLRAGDGLPLESVHPRWRLETIHPEGFDPMVGALAWLPDGRLAVATFEPKNNGVRTDEPNGTVWALSGWDGGDPEAIGVEKIADGLFHPLGMQFIQGWLYVAERDAITRRRDGDGDGFFETREVFAHGWIADNYHHFTFCLEPFERELWVSLSTSIGTDGDVGGDSIVALNGPNPPDRGTLMKIDVDSGAVTYVAGGFRTPNGVLPLGDGTALVGDNQGAWKPANRIDLARPGGFYGYYNETRVATKQHPEGGAPSLFSDRRPSPPALWLPQGEIASSPTAMVWAPRHGPFQGQVLIGDVKLGGIRRAFFEEVEGQLQGAAFRFCQGFEGGVNRLLWAPDRSLIVGMTGESATWSWRGTRTGLQRLVPTGVETFEFHSISATPGGFRLRFTDVVDPAQAVNLGRYQVRHWRYEATPEYGGSKLDEGDLGVTAARLLPSGREVELTVPGLREGTVVWIRADLQAKDGTKIWSPESWYTLNRVPGRELPAPPPVEERGVLVFSRTAGFRHGSIPAGIARLEAVAGELGLPFEATEDASAFADDNLARFRAVVFLNTTGDVLNLGQEAAFERWIRAGGGFMGVHAASDTEYDWPFYRQLIGAHFLSHPAIQAAAVDVLDHDHPSTRHLDGRWVRTDEWYDFRAEPSSQFSVLLELDESSYEGERMVADGHGASHPIAWFRELGLARCFYTGGGHTDAAYDEPDFVQHLRGALAWVARLED